MKRLLAASVLALAISACGNADDDVDTTSPTSPGAYDTATTPPPIDTGMMPPGTATPGTPSTGTPSSPSTGAPTSPTP
jgi:hypothetical protein